MSCENPGRQVGQGETVGVSETLHSGGVWVKVQHYVIISDVLTPLGGCVCPWFLN